MKPTIDQLYVKYWYSMYKLAFSIVSNKHDAEDIIADIFSGLLLHPERLDKILDFAKYLHWKTKLVCYDKLDRSAKILGEEYIDEFSIDEIQAIELNMIKSSMLNDLIKEIDKLPKKTKRIINLSYIQGYSNREICRLLNINYQSVRNAKSRAKFKLKSILNP